MWYCSLYTSFFLQTGCAVNGFANALIGAAAADIATHGVIDILIGGIGIFAQQYRSSHDLPALAITALRHIFLGPCLLQGMTAIGGKSFNGNYGLTLCPRNRRNT